MKVTARKIKIRSYWEALRSVHFIIQEAWLKLCISRIRYENEMLKGYLNNPNIKWKSK